jgi:hypothetical protein
MKLSNKKITVDGNHEHTKTLESHVHRKFTQMITRKENSPAQKEKKIANRAPSSHTQKNKNTRLSPVHFSHLPHRSPVAQYPPPQSQRGVAAPPSGAKPRKKGRRVNTKKDENCAPIK